MSRPSPSLPRGLRDGDPPPAGPQPDGPAGTAWRLRLALPDEGATARLAAGLAARLRPGDAVLLSGPIGAGKTALARALIRARLGDPGAEVPSPSFTLVQTYGEDAPGGPLWHADLHRLSSPGEAVELGLAEALGEALVIVEWPDRLGPLAPAGALRIDLEPDPRDEGMRHATLSGEAGWARRLEGLHG